MYELNDNQKEWFHSKPDPLDIMRFLIHGPADTVTEEIEGVGLKTFGRLRGIKITACVDSIAFALKEAEAIRTEYIKALGMIPLDEEGMGIADTPEQKVAA